MPVRAARISKQFANDTTGGVAIVAVIALPAILGVAGLALEYGTALLTNSGNQRTSDLAAFAAAFEYSKTISDNTNDRALAAEGAARSIAVLNGVSSEIFVSFDDPTNASFVEVIISENRPIFLSRLIRSNDQLRISTFSRVALGEPGDGFIACIISLDPSAKEGFRVNGNAGTYDMEGCGIGSNAEVVVRGQTLTTTCAAPEFGDTWTCDEQTEQDGFTDPYAHLTNWPNDPDNSEESQICDYTGTFPDDMAVRSGKDYQLNSGVLCVDQFSSDFDKIFSNPSGLGNTVIVKAGVDFQRGGNYSLSITPPRSGNFSGVAIYAPQSSFTLSGNPDFSVEGLGCSGFVVGSMRFDGNVTVNAACSADDVNYGAGSAGPTGRPRLVQ